MVPIFESDPAGLNPAALLGSVALLGSAALRECGMPVRTELVWEGKYDAQGRRVAPVRVALPFQTVETVNETTLERRTLFSMQERERPWRNRLIWGDKKYVLPSLLPEFAGQVNLIYIDPPFDTGADFSFTATLPEAPDDEDDAAGVSFTKQPSVIEQKAYRDTWGRGIDSYLQWFYETVTVLHELLAETGSIYVHLDWHVCHYAKAVLDQVFGAENFINEIVWKRAVAKALMSVQLPNNHDVIYLYQKSENAVWHGDEMYIPYDEENLDEKTSSKYTHRDEDGRIYRLDNLINPNQNRPNLTYEFLGVKKVWRWTKERMQEAYKEGIVVQTKPGSVPQLKRYLDEQRGRPLDDVWTDLPPVNSQAHERLAYPTQKPSSLLERIIKASSNENDLVLDCFCGSGTTAAVAERLNRRWIACDLGRFAIHTTRKRLLNVPEVRPFVVQNLGKYERQLWLAEKSARDEPPGSTRRGDSKDAGMVEETREGQSRGETSEGSESAERSRRVKPGGSSGSGGSSAPGDTSEMMKQRAYIEFILQLYHATPLTGYAWLHGSKAGRFVHVGSVEGPVTDGDVRQIVVEFKKAMGNGSNAPTTNGVDVLGWDFAFEVNEQAKQQSEAANVQLKFKRIPRDVMDKRAVEQGDIKFFELGALAVKASSKGKMLTLELTDFVIPPDDVPADVQGQVRHWSQWIDFWAVDFDNHGDTFHNEWQAFRTKKSGKLALSTAHPYAEAGEYRVVVKVIDILGNDTTKAVKAKVR